MLLPGTAGSEWLIIAAVALIVVGPKDLPLMLRKLGAFVGRMRSMAAEFRASFDEMARQSELDELRKEVEAMRQGRALETAVGADEIKSTFSEIDASLQGGGASFYPGYDPDAEMRAGFDAPPPIEAPAPKPRARRTASRPISAPAKPRARAAKPKSTPLVAEASPARKRKPRSKPDPGAVG
jgi:sec-independent protein translocase protein TatB